MASRACTQCVVSTCWKTWLVRPMEWPMKHTPNMGWAAISGGSAIPEYHNESTQRQLAILRRQIFTGSSSF